MILKCAHSPSFHGLPSADHSFTIVTLNPRHCWISESWDLCIFECSNTLIHTVGYLNLLLQLFRQCSKCYELAMNKESEAAAEAQLPSR